MEKNQSFLAGADLLNVKVGDRLRITAPRDRVAVGPVESALAIAGRLARFKVCGVMWSELDSGVTFAFARPDEPDQMPDRVDPSDIEVRWAIENLTRGRTTYGSRFMLRWSAWPSW